MKTPSPTLDEWRALYQAASDFKGLAAWEWMYDSDLFGVRNPETGEIGYCCVLGNLGEMFALAVYLGNEGLAGYLKMRSGEIGAPDAALLHYQKCLMADFEDRAVLEKDDLQTIRALGLKFRGNKAWPMFRSYRPGYHPWFITGEEARFLTVALQQAYEVALRFRDDPDMLEPPDNEEEGEDEGEALYFVRVSEQDGADLRWSDRWLKPEASPSQQKLTPAAPIDEVRVQRIKQRVSTRRGIWEADFFFSPSAVKEKGDERPWYPYICMWVDHHSLFILGVEMVSVKDYLAQFSGQLLSIIEQTESMPREIHVSKPEILALLNPLADKLGIKITQRKRLSGIDSARESMFSYFQGF